MPKLTDHLKTLKPYQIVFLILIFSGCCAFAFKSLSLIHYTSLWNDELATAEKSFQPSFASLLDQLRNDVHPPVYYVVLWEFSKMFGQTATFLRAFSWVSYLGGAVLLCFASWSYSGRGTAAVLTLVFALALPVTVTYSIEGKAYAFIYALICSATFFRLRLLAGEPGAAYSYGINWCFAALTHYYGMGLLLCQLGLDLRARRRTVKSLAWALVAPTLWMLVNLGFLVGRGGRRWLRKAGTWLLEDTLELMLGTYWPLILFILVILVLALCFTTSQGKENRSSSLISDWGLDASGLLFLTTFLISIFKPSSFPRYYVVILPSLIGVFFCWVALQLQDPYRRQQRFAMVSISMTLVLGIFWFDSFQALIPQTKGADRYENDFRTPALIAAQSQLKFTPQCEKFNVYDHVLRQERLLDPAAAWNCLTETNQSLTAWSETVLGSATANKSEVFLAVTGPSVHGARTIEPYIAALQARGLRCFSDPHNTTFMRAFHCNDKPLT
ncbi:MAG: hypothetical protein ACKO24_05075 [Leptolyngbyaceae cyanobacterium]